MLAHGSARGVRQGADKVAGFVSMWMVGEWLGVDEGRRRTKSYWWYGGFAAARQTRPDAAQTPRNCEPGHCARQVIRIENVSRVFTGRRGHDDVPALDRISLASAAGEIVAVVGPSGCGKTTPAGADLRFADARRRRGRVGDRRR